MANEFEARLKKANQEALSQAQQQQKHNLPAQRAKQTRDYKKEHAKARKEILDAIDATELLQTFNTIVFGGYGRISFVSPQGLQYHYVTHKVGDYHFGTAMEAQQIAKSPGHITPTYHYQMYSFDGYALEEGTENTDSHKLVVVGFGFKSAELPNPSDGRSGAELSVGYGQGRKAVLETARRLNASSIYHIHISIESTSSGKTTLSGRFLRRPGFHDAIDASLLTPTMKLIAMNELENIARSGYFRK